MITKEKIAEIIREETWLEVDSARLYGIDEAAEKIMQAVGKTVQQKEGNMTYLQSCPCCGNENEFRTKREAEREWKRWLRNAQRWVKHVATQQSVEPTECTECGSRLPDHFADCSRQSV